MMDGALPPVRPMLIAQPGTMGPFRLKNRIITGPIETNYGTSDGFSSDRDKRYYAERAKGGVAMIVTEAMNISAEARNHNNSLCVYHDRFIPGLHAVVRAIKDNRALAVAQLNHRGQLLRRTVAGTEPVGPVAGQHLRRPASRCGRCGWTRSRRSRARSWTRPGGYGGPATTRSNCMPRTAICSSNSSPSASIPYPETAHSLLLGPNWRGKCHAKRRFQNPLGRDRLLLACGKDIWQWRNLDLRRRCVLRSPDLKPNWQEMSGTSGFASYGNFCFSTAMMTVTPTLRNRLSLWPNPLPSKSVNQRGKLLRKETRHCRQLVNLSSRAGMSCQHEISLLISYRLE